MSPEAPSLAPLQAQVLDGVHARLDGLTFSHAEPMRQQLRLTQSDDASLGAPALCLLVVEALGGDSTKAMPAAIALALLEISRDVAVALAAGERGALAAAWGLPRALNAGDALYCLAHSALLDLRDGALDDAGLAAAASMLDAACRGVSEELFAPDARRRALTDAALVLGALLGGATPETARRVQHDGIAALDITTDARARLEAALRELP